MTQRWPVVIPGDEIFLRPLRFRDRGQWNLVREQNRAWLSPWEATIPRLNTDGEFQHLPSYFEMVRTLNSEARAARSYSFAIWHGHNLIGQISLGGVILGALRGGHIGYWIDRNYANNGYTTVAVGLVTEFAFSELLLHRIEINLRPENIASRRVAEKSGYIFEGNRARYLHIDGDWRDHVCFVRENPSIK
jgi:[ribosomal protein S5]-alanine N-acetyltransferase